jgi:hypothetical protein
MSKLLPWSSAEVGDLDIFLPAIPCLFVNTWYVDGVPDSTVSYFWQDEATGIVHHELLLSAPVSYEEAMDWAQAHASSSDIERIHVRHARSRATATRQRKSLRKTAKSARPASGKRAKGRAKDTAPAKAPKAVKAKRRMASKKSARRKR